MSTSQKNNRKALLFVGALYCNRQYFIAGIERLKSLYGGVTFETEEVLWGHSDYYAKELGTPIHRKFLFFDALIGQEQIKNIKLDAIGIEDSLSFEGNRTVNLDPGYITAAKVVLATTKDYSHRIYLGDGIFAEVTLSFSSKDGSFKSFAFTYSDYREAGTISLFNRIRNENIQRLTYPGRVI